MNEQEEIHDRAYFERMVAESTPGRFEGEPPWTAYFWDAYMNGDGENVWQECEHSDSGEECYCEPDIDYTEFVIDPSDVAMFPELAGHSRVRLYSSETGFVSTEVI